MQITFWSFSKRRNSTKIPTAEGKTISFLYKDSADLHNPIITISEWNDTWNYAKIGAIYFFVDSCQIVNRGIYTVQLAIDVLSTYKADILSTKAYVLYSANNYDVDLVDNRIVNKGRFTSEKTTVPVGGFSEGGTYALTVVSSNVFSENLSVTYFMQYAIAKQVSALLNNPDMWEELAQYFKNPMDAIVEAYWLPFDVSAFVNLAESEIVIGKYKTGILGQVAIDAISPNRKTTLISIPTRSVDFLQHRPYTTMQLYMPIVGLVDLNPSDFYNWATLSVDYSLDVLTGNVVFEVWAHNYRVAVLSGNAKLQIPLGQVQSRIGAWINGAAGAIAAGALYASGHPYAAVTSGAYAAAAVATRLETVNNGGYSGSVLGASMSFGNFELTVNKYETNTTIEEVASVIGGATFKAIYLNTCSGFTQTENASVSINGYVSEMNTINSMLNGGVYIE